MQRLELRQQEILQLLERREVQPMVTPVQVELQHRELRELLLEVLQTTQPPPEQEIARLAGLPQLPTSAPSSAS